MLTMYFTKKGRLLKHQPKSGIYYRIDNPSINRREFAVGIKCIYGGFTQLCNVCLDPYNDTIIFYDYCDFNGVKVLNKISLYIRIYNALKEVPTQLVDIYINLIDKYILRKEKLL